MMLLLLLLLLVAVALAAMYARSVQCGADFPKDATVAGADLGSSAPLTLRDVGSGLVGRPDLLLEHSSGRWVLIWMIGALGSW